MNTIKQRVGEMIREVTIRPEQIEEARRKAEARRKELKEQNKKHKNSITDSEHLEYGYLGEMLFAEAMGIAVNDTYNYDMVLADIRIEVKTKCCNSVPLPYYECSVADANTKQECDFYVHVRVMEDFSRAWILGKKRKDEYLQQAVFRKKGELDPNSPGRKFPFKADCHNLKISDLMPIIYPERNEEVLELFAKYLLMPTCKFTDPSSEDSIIYRKGYVEITGRGFDAPDPHRHYTLREFQEKLNNDAEFKEFCEKLELPK